MSLAYVLKTFPRLSQTFIVNEILAHEAASQPLRIETLRHPRPEDAQADVSAVRAAVHRLGDAASTERGEALIAAQAEELAQRVRHLGIRHLHAHFGNSAAEVARLAAERAGIGYSFTAHARDIFLDDLDHDALALRLRAARQVVTVSDYNRQHLITRYGLAPDHVVRIYNGLDLRRFSLQAGAREPLILAVGRLIEKKGFGDLIDACALLRDRGLRMRCVIAGGGPLMATLAHQIDTLDLNEQVRLLGAVPSSEVQHWMQRAAVFAAPCVVGADGDRDGLPTVLLEAMALGCPCVSTDVTGIPEVLSDGHSGLQVPQHDAVALADALGRLLADPALGERLARQARARIESDFDIHHNVARLRRVFASDASPALATAAP
ncbi:glycosyltransferase [Sphaerotilus mobilis]|uniref:Glycosyltransferase involved in cell wall biosynthesis n=1 Tax=Sphaerotilus mobilis TaxID=47994 RepID=A0A4Q7LSZ2_9BURK|nr:glycosyltransferase [Sphaerotilus mobilis]RZS56829.1 glycosyltransferase involved in cell wall biosynthesis [Sphaerotilus mobilis]